MTTIKVRKSLPRPDYKKYEELAHYIIYRVGNLPNFGITMLWKILYFSDFDNYELFYNSITGESYRKIVRGPAPCHIEVVLEKLEKEEKITKVKGAKFYGKSLKKYVAEKEIIPKHLSAEELKIVRKVIQRLKSLTATQVSEYSHLDTPWKVTNNKEIIDYELVFHRHPITSVA